MNARNCIIHSFREKEDIYKALMTGHYFLADTLLDVSRKGPEPDQDNRYSKSRQYLLSRVKDPEDLGIFSHPDPDS